MSEENSELKIWLYAFLVMLALSLIFYAVSVFGFVILNQAFQISIFYVPTIILAIIIIYAKIKSVNKSV